MNIDFYSYPKIVILPIREPWSSMIANKTKLLELRKWIPKFPIGTLILIVATGSAPGPRAIVASCVYGGLYSPDQLRQKAAEPKGLAFLQKIGGADEGENGFILKDIIKGSNPLPLNMLGCVKATPMRFQYIEPEFLDGKYEA